MKLITKIGVVIMVAAFIEAGCGHGQLTDPYAAAGGGSSDGTTAGEVSLESFTDETGAALEGATLLPDKSLLMSFSGAVGAVSATVRCDGVLQEIVVEQVSESSYSISPVSEWPQLSQCTVSGNTETAVSSSASVSAGKAFFQQTFSIGCSLSDSFDNFKTIDPNATHDNPGSGCWRVNHVDVPPENYDILDGRLKIDAATGPEEVEFVKYPFMAKRYRGDNYDALLVLDALMATYPTETIVEGHDIRIRESEIQIFLWVSDNIDFFFADPPQLPKSFYVGYSARGGSEDPGAIDGVEYSVQSGVFAGGNEPSGDGVALETSEVPSIGFVKNGMIMEPYYSWDKGVTKERISIGDEKTTIDIGDLFDDPSELDIGIIVTTRKHQTFAEVFFGSFVVEALGDAVELVQQ